MEPTIFQSLFINMFISFFCVDVKNINTNTFLGFSVYLSNTTDKEEGVLCFRDTNYTRATIPNPVNIECPYHGRYIIYHNNRTHLPYPTDYSNYAFTNLCEVEVYGNIIRLLYFYWWPFLIIFAQNLISLHLNKFFKSALLKYYKEREGMKYHLNIVRMKFISHTEWNLCSQYNEWSGLYSTLWNVFMSYI